VCPPSASPGSPRLQLTSGQDGLAGRNQATATGGQPGSRAVVIVPLVFATGPAALGAAHIF
jgi:hypothetical protein